MNVKEFSEILKQAKIQLKRYQERGFSVKSTEKLRRVTEELYDRAGAKPSQLVNKIDVMLKQLDRHNWSAGNCFHFPVLPPATPIFDEDGSLLDRARKDHTDPTDTKACRESIQYNIDKIRAKEIVEKSTKVQEAIEEVQEYARREIKAKSLDQQMIESIEKAVVGKEVDKLGIKDFEKFAFPMIRRVFPSIAAGEAAKRAGRNAFVEGTENGHGIAGPTPPPRETVYVNSRGEPSHFPLPDTYHSKYCKKCGLTSCMHPRPTDDEDQKA